jgi:TRAP transporter 4TM/12TM fusion protein
MTDTATPAGKPLPPSVDTAGKFRTLPPLLRNIDRVLVLFLSLVGAAWALELQYYLPTPIFINQYLALIMTVALAAVFMTVKARRSEEGTRVPWYDWIAVAASVVTGMYVVVRYPEIQYDPGALIPAHYIMGAIVLILVLEATRRMTGWSLVILGVIFILYAKFPNFFPGILNQPFSPRWDRLAIFFYLDNTAILGVPIRVTATIIIAFILFGRVLYAVNGDKVLTDFALALMGKQRGGPAKVAVIASSLFGTISGSAVSNVVMDGPITIPMMRRTGYPGHLAAAIESVASTGGQIMPPVMGITAFLIADFLSVDYAEVVLAALVPALLYYLALFIQVDLEAAKRGFRGMRDEDLPKMREVMRKGWVFLIPIALLIWTLFGLHWQPARSAMAAVGATIVVAFFNPATRPTFGRLVSAFEETGRNILDLVVITLVAGLVIGAVNTSGLGSIFAQVLIETAQGSLVLLLILTAFVCIILGMGMPTGVIYVMLAVLVAPALAEMGVVPMAAHLFLFYFGLMSMVTPPVCLATFAAASIAGANFWSSGWAGMRLAIVAYIVPFVMVYQPGLIFEGTATEVMFVTGKTVVGVIVLSLGMVGYCFGPLSWLVRGLFTLAGALIMLVPMVTPLGTGLVIAAVALATAAALPGYFKARASQA